MMSANVYSLNWPVFITEHNRSSVKSVFSDQSPCSQRTTVKWKRRTTSMTICDEQRVIDVVMNELMRFVCFLGDFIEMNQFLFVLVVKLNLVAIHKLASQANRIANRSSIKNASDMLLQFLFFTFPSTFLLRCRALLDSLGQTSLRQSYLQPMQTLIKEAPSSQSLSSAVSPWLADPQHARRCPAIHLHAWISSHWVVDVKETFGCLVD